MAGKKGPVVKAEKTRGRGSRNAATRGVLEMATHSKFVWKNVRKIKSRRKQGELSIWLEENVQVSVWGLSETGLVGEEHIDVRNVRNGVSTVEGSFPTAGRGGSGCAN